MSHYRSLFIGLTTIDIQYFVNFFPEPNKKVKTDPPGILVGGPATNAAVAFSKLNGGSSLVSAVGNNSFRKFIENDFQLTGLNHFDLNKNKEEHVVLATVVTSTNSGERTILTHNPATINPDIQHIDVFTNVKPQIVMLDGFYPEFAVNCAKLAYEKNIPVIMDCGSWKPQFNQLLDFCDIAICSEDFYPTDCNCSEDTIKYLQKKKIKHIAISRGDKGILYCDNNQVGEIAVKKVNVIDTLGAGDFLHGAFCYYYLESKKNFCAALKKASAFATRTCEYSGTRSWLNYSE